MRRSGAKRVALAAALGAVLALPGLARAQANFEREKVEVGVNYVADIANAHPGACGCFTLQGGGVNGAVALSRHFAVGADVSLVATGHVSGTDYALSLLTALAGPEYRLRDNRRFAPYAHALFGMVHGFNTVFPDHGESSANSFAFEVGAGSEFNLNRR